MLLKCEPEELKARIGNESRVKIGKLSDPDAVDRSLGKYELRTPIPGRESLVIDTTELDPQVAARQVVDHFALADTHEASQQENM